ncbi:uncharacterized protein N0V89_003200 [Didymosphaeria variabile]|uniref:Uncharacterized protein n=1 Tax=Didymosphaeria variabile TaxID=1932322 RepID=A0A9W8XTY9_9PLEO|nr:uncharacterized protein N0V89_003200 [Didymosphaeria variabile]KAJ4358616.1 hypothetical protein N0V89_003200 [Didymosphaeria variabile]
MPLILLFCKIHMHSDFIDEILSREEWEKRTKRSQPSSSQILRKKSRSVLEPKFKHKPQDEKRPDHVFFTLDTANMDTKMNHMVFKVLTLLSGQAYENIEEIGAFMQKLQLNPGPETPEWHYALIGKHGEGKSTLTNCLLGRHKLAGVSKGTKSCTQFATEFRYKAGANDDTDKSDVTISFFDELQLRAHLEENIMRYGRFHHPTSEEEESDEDSLDPALTRTLTKYDEYLSKEAYDVLRIIVKGDEQAEEKLDRHLNHPENFTNGSLIEFYHRKQRERLQALGVDGNNTIVYLNVPDKLDLEHEQGERDITAVRKVAESLAPFVRSVKVATGGMLLRYGLVLVDIPGYGDLNQARIASANVHRRSAHGEIIIGAASRIEDSEDLDGQITRSRKAHGDRNTILVMNQIDKAYDAPDYDAVRSEIEENKESPFPELHIALEATEDDSDAEEAYDDHIASVAQCAMVRQFAEPCEDALKQRHGGRISVYSVVASAAHDWLDPYRAEDPTWGPYMSGVPHLRRGLLCLTAEQKLQIYHKHYFQILPGFVDDAQRILTKTVGQKEILATTRRCLEQCFRNAIRGSRAAKDVNSISIVLPIYTGSEKNTVTKRIKALIQVWSAPTVVQFNTFMHTLVCRGIPTSYASAAYRGRDINWNRDLLDTMETPADNSHAYTSLEAYLSDWKVTIKHKSTEISNSITGPITDLWASIEDVITASSAPLALKGRMRGAWRKVKHVIRDMVNRFPEQITAAIDKVYQEVTTEEDIGCMIAIMNIQTYKDAAYQRRGKKVYTRQRRSLIRSLCDPDSNGRMFVDRYENAAMNKMTERIAQVSEEFIAAVDTKLKEFVRITKQFMETDVYNTSQHVAARKVLRRWLPEFQDLLLDCQRRFPGQQDQQDVQFMGSIKRARSSECEESAIKKIKVEDEYEDENSIISEGKTDKGTTGDSTTDGRKTAPSCGKSVLNKGIDWSRGAKTNKLMPKTNKLMPKTNKLMPKPNKLMPKPKPKRASMIVTNH